MARATYGSIITDLKGSIGGTTFQHNPSGKISRARPRISSKYSLTQNEKNIYLALLNKAWHSLSIDDVVLWNNFATANTKDNYYGEEKTLTGYQWFISVNSYNVLSGNPVVSSPPAYALPPDVPACTLRCDGNSIKIYFDSEVTQVNENLMIYSTVPLTTSHLHTRSKFIYTRMVTTRTFTVLDITSYWESVHGISYPPSASYFNFSLNVLLYNLDVSKGLPGSAIFLNDLLSSEEQGIGQMIIENNFVIY